MVLFAEKNKSISVLASFVIALFFMPLPIAQSMDMAYGVPKPTVKPLTIHSVSKKPVYKATLKDFLKSETKQAVAEVTVDPDLVVSNQTPRNLYYSGHYKSAYHTALSTFQSNAKSTDDSLWIGGLSAMRFEYHMQATKFFETLAKRNTANKANRTAAAYWAARAHENNGNHRTARHWYAVSAKYNGYFYAMLAQERLGKNFSLSSYKKRRYQKTGYRWLPAHQYAIDADLVHAMVLQESRFNPKAHNASGASGLMQILPQTARYVTQDSTITTSTLMQPKQNLKIGQAYIQYLFDHKRVKGDLLNMLIAYNAGPGNLYKWQKTLTDLQDPVLFLESIPSAETRHYTKIVLKDYWTYGKVNKKHKYSLTAMARHKPVLYNTPAIQLTDASY